MHEKLKNARKALHLTQDFVARQMVMSRTTIVAIEVGNRDVSAEEMATFSELYGIPMEELVHGEASPTSKTAMFARTFSELSPVDQDEIISLMLFKKRYKESLNA